MILNFQKNKTISQYTGMPVMSDTLNGWEVPLSLIKITQTIVNNEAVKTETEITFKGVWQPLKDDLLNLKPEGQRSWEWIWIHARASELNLKTADKVIFNNKRYKVIEIKDYSLNGYIEYQLCRDYENA